MATDYLPAYMSVQQACEWLHERTGETWSLPRLMDALLTPWIWLDYKPELHDFFEGRQEGYLAPMVFVGDSHRLKVDGIDALLTFSRTPSGELVNIGYPGLRAPIEMLRFKREDVEELANQLAPGSAKESSRDGFRPGSWQEQAYAIGKEWMLQEEGRTGKRPGVNAIAKHVEQAFKDKDIRSDRLNDYLSRETIKREALKGITGRARNGRK